MTNLNQEVADGNSSKVIAKQENQKSSVIFRRNRAIGYVSNHVPAIIKYVNRRKDTIITTCIGRSFQVYTASHFRLLHVGPVHADEITALACSKNYTFTASDKCIYAWRAGKELKHVFHGHKRNVHTLLPFGKHLIAVDESNVLKMWEISSTTVYLELEFNADEFLMTAVVHPPTYINKIVIGSQQGQLKLWNLKHNKLLFTFTGHGSRVTCLQTAPAIDVIAVGHADGVVLLLNLKYDQMVMKFTQDWGRVTAIDFRTDGPPIMATSSTNGFVAFWNLEEKRIMSQLQTHTAAVSTGICFPNEPLFLTTSPDNSMKLWIFDMTDGGARLLRIREGHTAPPLCIRYHGSNGVSILSSSEDSSMRIFSIISESLHRSMGKASYDRKASKKHNRLTKDYRTMPPIVEFTSEVTREKEWDNIAAIHNGLIQTTTWSFDKCRMGEHRLVPKKFQRSERTDFKSEATCLILTNCGNFVIIGYSSGDVERFNIQSGIQRASYGEPAHESAVRGVTCDNLNQFIASGCSDGLLKFWPFKENVKKCIAHIKFNDGIAIIRSHRESAMIAVGLVSFVVYVVDSDTKSIVRKFEGHKSKINDMTFSPDSRWLITAAMDSTIKVWDIPSSYMIDHFLVERPCISLSMSPTGDFLATAHVNFLGIYLWSNKMLFNQISLRSINPFSPAPYVDLPSSSLMEQLNKDLTEELDNMNMHDDTEHESSEDSEGDEINFKYKTPKQLSKSLITLSGQAASRWQNLLDLDVIKKRNKPKAPPKKPKQAPFFLPTVAGMDLKFDLEAAKPHDNDNNSRVVNAQPNFSNLSVFGKILHETQTNNEYSVCVEHLKKLGPSMIDFEIKSLHPVGGGSYAIMVQFLNTIEFMFASSQDFELAQSYLSAFLRSHGMAVIESTAVVEALRKVSIVQEASWQRLEEKFHFGIGVVAALRNFAHNKS